jgi:hypothetical protein
MKRSGANPKRGMVAWLVTWEGTKRAAEPLAAILNHRMNADCVAAIVELLYALQGHVDDLVSYARKPPNNPYQATRSGNGFTCGHNPYLDARLVDKLKVETNAETGVQTITWMERPVHELADKAAPGGPLVKESVPARPGEIERKATSPLWRVGG